MDPIDQGFLEAMAQARTSSSHHGSYRPGIPRSHGTGTPCSAKHRHHRRYHRLEFSFFWIGP